MLRHGVGPKRLSRRVLSDPQKGQVAEPVDTAGVAGAAAVLDMPGAVEPVDPMDLPGPLDPGDPVAPWDMAGMALHRRGGLMPNCASLRRPSSLMRSVDHGGS